MATLLTSLLLALVGPSRAADEPTLTTIIIDGAFSDWAQVLLNPLQVTVDGNGSVSGPGCYPGNPDRDCVTGLGGTGRDVLTFAWTYDTSSIYTYLERDKENANMTYSFVMDVGADGFANATDFVLDVAWAGGNNIKSAKLFRYVPVRGSGDAMACETQVAANPQANQCVSPSDVGFVDGYLLRGSRSATPSWSLGNVPGGGGKAFEVYIPWSELGVAPGTPIFWHVVASVGGTLSSAEDNVGGPQGKLGAFGVYAVRFAPNREGAAPPAGAVAYQHTITNLGQIADRYDLFATSTTGSALAYFTDDAGSKGTLFALDQNGDGDFIDAGEFIAGGFDSDADGSPDTPLLSHSQVFSLFLELRPISGLGGGVDVLTATAQSWARTSVRSTITDRTRIGQVTLAPDSAKTSVENVTVAFGPYTLTNQEGAPDSFDLTLLGTKSWPVALFADNGSGTAPGALLATDSNADGAWDSAGTLNTGSVPAGGTRLYWVTVAIPSGIALGLSDTITLRARSPVVIDATGSCTGTVTVYDALTLIPSYAGNAGAMAAPPGTRVYLPHRLINSAETTDTVTLTDQGANPSYPLSWWTDPNADGNPSDGAAITSSFQLAPFGGTLHLVTVVDVPPAAASGLVDLMSRATGLIANVSAEDDVLVSRLATYKDALFKLPARVFGACAPIYAQATGLTEGGSYTLAFYPTGSPRAGSPASVGPSGVGQGGYTLLAADPPGDWTVALAGAPSATLAIAVEQSGTLAVDVPASIDGGQALTVSALAASTAQVASYTGTVLALELAGPAPATTVVLSSAQAMSDLAPGAAISVPQSWSTASLAPGDYTVTARWLTSCGGPMGDPATPIEATGNVTIVLGPPSLVSPANGGWVASTLPTLSGLAVSGATVDVYLDGVLDGSTIAVDGAFSYVPGAALALVPHDWYAIQTASSTTSPPSATFTFDIDLASPTSVISQPAGSVWQPGPSALIAGTASDVLSGVARVEVSVDGGATWGIAAGTTTWSFAAAPGDGVHAVKARAIDLAGNVEGLPYPALSLWFDGTSPAATIDTPLAASLFGAAELPIILAGTASDALSLLDRVEVSSDGGTSWSAATGTASWTFTFAPSADGNHVLELRAIDNAGNVGPSPLASLVVSSDATAPTVTIATTSGASATSPILVTGSAADAGLATVEVSVDGGATWSAATGTTAWSHALWPTADGTYTLSARATDVAGNVSPEPWVALVYDTTPPMVTLSEPAEGAALGGASVALGGGASDALSGLATLELDTGAGFVPVAGATGASAAIAASYTPAADGPQSLRVRATDVAGNTTTLTRAFTYNRPCAALAECASGRACVAGECGACASDADCGAGSCSGGTCVAAGGGGTGESSGSGSATGSGSETSGASSHTEPAHVRGVGCLSCAAATPTPQALVVGLGLLAWVWLKRRRRSSCPRP